MESSRPEWLQNALDYLLDNVFDILTIATTAYVFFRHEFVRAYRPEDFADLAAWILAVLGLIAVSGLWQQHRRLAAIENLSQETHDLVAKHLGGQVRAADFFWSGDKKIAAQDFAQADDVYVVGMILNRTVRDHMAAFGDRLAAGANLRFLILDWQNETLMSIMPYRSYGARPKEWWQERIRQTEGHIEDIPISEDVAGTLKVGYLPYFPSFGMWLIDPDKPHGKIHVEIYHHRTPELNPKFYLHADGDPFWYDHFRRQFELLWQSCQDHGRVRDISYASPRRRAAESSGETGTPG